MQIHYISGDLDKDLRQKIERAVQGIDAGMWESTIAAILTEQGYLDSRVSLSVDTIRIDTGARFEIGNIYLSVVTPTGGIETDTLKRYQGQVATKNQVDKLKADILAIFLADGHYFASINVGRVEFEHDLIHFHLKLISGPPIMIERLRFYGLKKSRPNFVEKLSGLRRGEPFVQKQLEAARRSLATTGFLSNDSMPQVLPNENYDKVELLFYLKENKSSSLELGGGYLPGQGEIDGEFVGRLRFQSLNLFGAGRRMELLLDRKDRASSIIELRFGQPLFIPDHLELMLHARQVDYDSSYHSFTINGGLSLFTGAGTKITGSGSWTKVEPQRSSQPSSRLLTGDLTFLTQNYDYLPNPSTGRKIEFGVSYIRRISQPDSLVGKQIDNESKFCIGADNFFGFGSRWVFRFNVEANGLITSRDLVNLSEQLKMGGYSSLRGYRQDQFAGRRMVLGQAEIRLRPSPEFTSYIFADIGHIYSKKETQPGVISSESISRLGSGFGIFVGGENARMTLEVGWGRHDRFDDGKIHLGLATLF